MDDALLLGRAKAGDAAAFESLVRRHYRAAFAVALAIAGNQMDAEDVCQDAFVRAAERINDCRQPEKFAPWLLQIVRNRARNLRRYLKVRAAQPLDDVAGAAGPEPGWAAERADLRARLETALADLSEIQRQVVLLHDLEGWKHREIGEALGFSEGMSRQHLYNARQLLREKIGVRFFREYSSD